MLGTTLKIDQLRAADSSHIDISFIYLFVYLFIFNLLVNKNVISNPLFSVRTIIKGEVNAWNFLNCVRSFFFLVGEFCPIDKFLNSG